jgi:hypothetical protein
MNDPISTFANSLNTALSSYTKKTLSTDSINNLYSQFKLYSPTMLASVIYLLGDGDEIIDKENLKEKLPSRLEDEEIMKSIYDRHIGKKRDPLSLKKVKMDIVRYSTLYLGITYLSEIESEKEEKSNNG